MSVFKLPPLPRFDYESGTNPFAWIIAQAPKARAARATAQLMQRNAHPSRMAILRTPNPHAQTQDATGRQKDGHIPT